MTLSDSVEVYPAHGAGSLCGRNISPERRSTIGKERAFNYALRPMSEEEFVRLLTADLPERPEYFARDAQINRAGAAALDALPPLPGLSPEQVAAKQAEDVVVLDTRPAAQFGAAHLPGAVNIGLGGQYASWAARILGLDQPLILVAEDPERLEESRMRLARVGMEKVVGFLEGGVLAWERAGLPLRQTPQVSVLDLREQLRSRGHEWKVLDVRNPGEWRAGHLENVAHAPLDRLSLLAPQAARDAALAALDSRAPLAVHCKSGYRSSIAASLLERAGFTQVMNVVGGFDAWQAQKLPAVAEGTACSTAAEPAGIPAKSSS
jgi:rhodanese-related sulfurtransferase